MAGRNKAGELTAFTFRDSGITVKIRKVSPMIATDVARAFPDPNPPAQLVDYGEPKGKVLEANYSDPDYLKAKKANQEKMLEAIQRVYVLRGVVVEGDDWKEEVKEYREFMKEQTGVPVDEPSDLVVYVLRICVGSDGDLEDLLNAITRRSQPTPKEVDLAKGSFRG